MRKYKAISASSGLALALVYVVAGAAESYTPPVTSWGEPDLRGIWPLNHLISTPFQRPERFGERMRLTDEEFAAAKAKLLQG